MKVDFDFAESVFVDTVSSVAEDKGKMPEKVCLVLHTQKARFGSGRVLRVRIISLDGSFEPEVVKLKKLSMYDMTGHISQAIMEIFKAEIHEHNTCLQDQITRDTVERYPKMIDLEGIECYIQVDRAQGNELKLNMNMIYRDEKAHLLRPYSLRTEFGQFEGEKMDTNVDVNNLE
jgi:hypothetical protein